VTKETLVLQQIKKALDVFTSSKRLEINNDYEPKRTNRINNVNMIRHNIHVKIRNQ